MNEKFYIEVAFDQRNYGEERICGDAFISRKIKEESRTIAVLSDGMGHGVKANILATLTSTMAINFTREHKAVEKIAEMIMNTLPVCSERRMSYSTFTIVDIEHEGLTTILEYDNPQTIILRDNAPFNPGWNCLILRSEKNAGKEILSCQFRPRKEDRIIFCSDGVAQSGLGTEKYPLGWGRDRIEEYAIRLIGNSPRISAAKLTSRIVQMAHRNDDFRSKDDTTCASVYFRQPRKLLIVTGPPYEKEKDRELAEAVRFFRGRKVICGATTADIVARELGVEIEDTLEFEDPELPPVARMEGIDLVTEGILTLTKVTRILKDYSPSHVPGKGPADRIVRLVRDSDEIHIIIGTRVNIAHQDPTLPVELEMRRTVVKRMARFLEEKFLKEVSIRYI
ncbi:MAG TPA: stage II sporulation protein E [Bacteroides sp.]|nr:stage II sporulation protein E [Bacteroides sp.]